MSITLHGLGIGGGIAIPHPRYPVVLPGHLSLVRACYLEYPLDYHAADGKLVNTLFLMVCPTVHEHLQLLARLACVLRSAEFRNLLAPHIGQFFGRAIAFEGIAIG